jgi:very-short-patch-repair endonuclease
MGEEASRPALLPDVEKHLELMEGACTAISQILDSQEGLASMRFLTLSQAREASRHLSSWTQARDTYAHLKGKLASEWGADPGDDAEEWQRWLERLEGWIEVRRLAGQGSTPQALRRAAVEPSLRPDPQSLSDSLDSWEEAWDALRAHFEAPHPTVGGKQEFREAPFAAAVSQLDLMAERADEVAEWLDYKKTLEGLAKYGLGPAAEELLRHPELRDEELPRALEGLVFRAWLNWVCRKDPALATFRRDTQERLLREFRRLDKLSTEVARAETIEALEQRRRPLAASLPGSEVSILRREAAKRRRHMSLRRLFRQTFTAIQAIKPCWLMSPMSVSHFLQSEHTFDLVIFDEASQMRPEDSIPALYRGRQAIVCGDSRQLPPTPFFEARVLDRENGDEMEWPDDAPMPAYAPLESVLEALQTVAPAVFLRWHYRSRDESLIAFSNDHFYEGRLITFPNPRPRTSHYGVRHIYLEDGVYHRAASRTNPREVEEVCVLVREHLEKWGTSRSLGVVTMNEPQMNAVLDRLEALSLEDPGLRVLWDPAAWSGEPFFVKNLEAVQGDERDVMILSTVYGRDESGRMLMNFGPLNQQGGERRLNVAITRARMQTIVVTSMKPEDIDPARAGGPGAQALASYLRYARDEEYARNGVPGSAAEEPESALEETLAERIRSWGFHVSPRFGVGPYRVDLAVSEAQQPAEFVAAVECDGPRHHATPTVRERDRIRREWLEQMGWRVIRVHSMDWFRQPRLAEEHLKDALRLAVKEARKAPRVEKAHQRVGSQTAATAPTLKRVYQASEEDPSAILRKAGLVTYCSPTGPGLLDQLRQALLRQPVDSPEVRNLIHRIVKQEAPIHVELLIQRVSTALGRRKPTVVYEVRRLRFPDCFHTRKGFIYPRNFPRGIPTTPRIPNPDQPGTHRLIAWIPPEEIYGCVRAVLQTGVSLDKASLVTNVARLFGFRRLTESIRSTLRSCLSRLRKNGFVQEDGDHRLRWIE